MSAHPNDLSVLSRAATAPPPPQAPTAAAAVPAPPSRWKTRVLLPWAVIGAALALLAYASRDAVLPSTPVRVVPVVVRARAATAPNGGASTAPAEPASFTLQAPGWVEPDPYAVVVSALAEGVVADVLVLEGRPVKKGDVVARMIDDDARIALARADAVVLEREGELVEAEAARDAAQRDWDHPVERTRAVASGEAMLSECRAMHEKQASEIAAEAARVAELEDFVRRTEKSAASNAASESELVQAKLRLEAQRAMLAAARAESPVLRAKIHQYEAELVAARDNAKLRIPERKALDQSVAAVARARAALAQAHAARDDARLRLSRMEVRAQADGVVMSRHVEPGSAMMLSTDNPASAHVVRLYDPKRLQVRVDVPLADAGRVSVGQRAKIVVGVAPDRTFDGEVTRVVPEADIQRNTLQVKVRIADPSPDLRPEMLARVRFADPAGATSTAAADTTSQQVLAPESTIRRNADGRATAWVVDRGRSVAERRDVTLGEPTADGWVAVREGLRPGDQVIAGDVSAIHPGHRVEVVGEVDPQANAAPAAAITPNAPAGASPPEGGSRGAH